MYYTRDGAQTGMTNFEWNSYHFTQQYSLNINPPMPPRVPKNNPIIMSAQPQEFKFDYTNDNLIYINGQKCTRDSLVGIRLHELKAIFSEKDFARVRKARRQAQVKQAVTLWRLRKLKEFLLKEKEELKNEIEKLCKESIC